MPCPLALNNETSVIQPSPLNDEALFIDLKHAPDGAAKLASAPHPSQLNLARLLHRDLHLIFRRSGAVAQPLRSAAALALCNAADTLITCLLSPRELRPSIDPRVQLRGNFLPVPETPPTPCSVVGNLPLDLNGAYIRNGPNAAHLHNGEGFHIFDGDGMLHCVKIRNGAANFCARYVKTSRFKQEDAAGRPLFPKLFGTFTGIYGIARTSVTLLRAILGLLDLSQGFGLSNTSVTFFKGQVLSMSEEDMPYIIKVMESGELLTQGRFELPGKISMCAHPKIAPETGDMYAFSYPPSMSPFSIFKVSAESGEKSADVSVPLFDVPIVHDFAITRRYVIFPDPQLVVRPLSFLKGEALAVADARKVARLCVLPRDMDKAAQGAPRWFDAPSCNCLHYVNAWEEEESDEIVLIAPVLSSPLENALSLSGVFFTLTEIRLSIETGKVTLRKLCDGNLEFGTINQRYVGRRSKYAYFAEGGPGEASNITAVTKVDLETGLVVARRAFDAGCQGGEPCFVPRGHGTHIGQPVNKNPLSVNEQLPLSEGLEDDGYLLCFVYHSSTQLSKLLVMDALSSSLEVVASVQLPTRVPFGFHGCFISDQQLTMQP